MSTLCMFFFHYFPFETWNGNFSFPRSFFFLVVALILLHSFHFGNTCAGFNSKQNSHRMAAQCAKMLMECCCGVKILQRGSNYPRGQREIRRIPTQTCFLRTGCETRSLALVQRAIKGEKGGRGGCDLWAPELLEQINSWTTAPMRLLGTAKWFRRSEDHPVIPRHGAAAAHRTLGVWRVNWGRPIVRLSQCDNHWDFNFHKKLTWWNCHHRQRSPLHLELTTAADDDNASSLSPTLALFAVQLSRSPVLILCGATAAFQCRLCLNV